MHVYTSVHCTVDLGSLVTDKTPSIGIPSFVVSGSHWKFKSPQEAKVCALTKHKVEINISKRQAVFIFSATYSYYAVAKCPSRDMIR